MWLRHHLGVAMLLLVLVATMKWLMSLMALMRFCCMSSYCWWWMRWVVLPLLSLWRFQFTRMQGVWSWSKVWLPWVWSLLTFCRWGWWFWLLLLYDPRWIWLPRSYGFCMWWGHGGLGRCPCRWYHRVLPWNIHGFVMVITIQTGVTVRKRSIPLKISDVVPCDLEISRMTLKNNRAPLFATSRFEHNFIAICDFELELQSEKSQFWVKIDFFSPVTLKFDG